MGSENGNSSAWESSHTSTAKSRSEAAQSLEQLVGEQVLSFVPALDLRHPFDADASGCAFGMGGWVYLVFEDPDDGYRSLAAPLLAFKGDLYQLGGSLWPEPINLNVVCSMQGEGGGVLTAREVATGKVVFEIGTDNSDDYYPSYIARWTPPGLRAGEAA